MNTGETAAPALEVRGASLGYGAAAPPATPRPGDPVLAGLWLDFPAGEVTGLLGRSGCGKSTLLRALAGLHDFSAGELRRGGEPVPAASQRGRVGFVPQRPALLPWRTVLGNLHLSAEVRGQPQDRGAALELLSRFGLEQTATLYPHQLSGGMAQRVAILRAVLTGAEVLLLDEPFSALDALTRQDIQTWLRGVQRSFRPTTVLVTHDVREATALCDRVAVLSGSPARVGLRLDLRGLTPAGQRAAEADILAALQGGP
ncbi:ABC transporter ATP-binding protein [uncultured Deinococcus sp.]|uniref:ABC transporter ATP-binding protein n=1 Tax=uncultured Deinococcus sp. TaxID=158789 RepID=UPI00374990BF